MRTAGLNSCFAFLCNVLEEHNMCVLIGLDQQLQLQLSNKYLKLWPWHSHHKSEDVHAGSDLSSNLLISRLVKSLSDSVLAQTKTKLLNLLSTRSGPKDKLAIHSFNCSRLATILLASSRPHCCNSSYTSDCDRPQDNSVCGALMPAN